RLRAPARQPRRRRDMRAAQDVLPARRARDRRRPRAARAAARGDARLRLPALLPRDHVVDGPRAPPLPRRRLRRAAGPRRQHGPPRLRPLLRASALRRGRRRRPRPGARRTPHCHGALGSKSPRRRLVPPVPAQGARPGWPKPAGTATRMDWLTSTFGALATAPSWLCWLFAAAALLAPVYLGVRLWQFALALVAVLWLCGAHLWCWIVVLPPLRRAGLSGRILGLLSNGGFLPQISETERTAIAAGTVWLDGELFSGKPNLERLATADYPELTAEERAFLDGPVARACELTDDWRVWQERDLPPEVWDFLKRERFFGMIIPKEYGGLGLSASCNSAVVTRLTSRSMPLAITVMVPNSLGPAELLIHYGTQAQKQRWLPALARGEEIPCFALTEPGAGS